jgi:hypothetical protein
MIHMYDFTSGYTVPYVKLTNSCHHCREENYILVNKEQYELWTDGGLLIQHAFPNLEPWERDIILMGFHPKCWDEVFAKKDVCPCCQNNPCLESLDAANNHGAHS